MNAKKAKRIRKALREQGIDASECILLARSQHVVLAYSSTTLDEKGNPVVIGRVTAQSNYLDPTCGRAYYKQLKKVAA